MRAWPQQWRRFGRFNLVGLIGAGLQVSLLWLLTRGLGLPVLAATLIAVEIAVLHNFVWHERFTWREERFRTIKERATALCRFHVGNGCVSLIGNLLLVYWLVALLNVSVILAGVLAITACSILNFFVADRWVFGS